MVTNLNVVAESNDYKEQVVSSDSTKRVEEFIRHMNEASEEEQRKVYQFCQERANEYMSPELRAKLNGEVAENAEKSEYVSEEAVKNVDELVSFRKKLGRDYPNVDQPYKMAYEDAVYAFADNSAEEVAKTVAQNKMEDKSDKYIEA